MKSGGAGQTVLSLAIGSGSEVPCLYALQEYESLKYMHDMETSTWAQFTYPQNKNLRGGVGERKAK